MKYLQGYRYKEMGELLNKTAGAVRIEAHRAMRKLRSMLESSYAVYRKTTKEPAQSKSAEPAL
jgi:DNA-directed RNA polymerase specialized sigma24 family protein